MRDEDYIPASEREPDCDCNPTVPRAVAAHVMGCASDSPASRDELLDSHAIADDVRRDLAEALRLGQSSIDQRKEATLRLIALALARYDALSKETR